MRVCMTRMVFVRNIGLRPKAIYAYVLRVCMLEFISPVVSVPLCSFVLAVDLVLSEAPLHPV